MEAWDFPGCRPVSSMNTRRISVQSAGVRLGWQRNGLMASSCVPPTQGTNQVRCSGREGVPKEADKPSGMSACRLMGLRSAPGPALDRSADKETIGSGAAAADAQPHGLGHACLPSLEPPLDHFLPCLAGAIRFSVICNPGLSRQANLEFAEAHDMRVLPQTRPRINPSRRPAAGEWRLGLPISRRVVFSVGATGFHRSVSNLKLSRVKVALPFDTHKSSLTICITAR